MNRVTIVVPQHDGRAKRSIIDCGWLLIGAATDTSDHPFEFVNDCSVRLEFEPSERTDKMLQIFADAVKARGGTLTIVIENL